MGDVGKDYDWFFVHHKKSFRNHTSILNLLKINFKNLVAFAQDAFLNQVFHSPDFIEKLRKTAV